MAKHKLTAAFVAKIAAPARDRVIYWDESQPGFGVMVTAGGKRSWLCQYRAHHKTRRITIDGRLPLDEARKVARKHQGDVAHGKDPVEELRRKERSAKNSFQAVSEEYLAREAKRGLRSIRQNEKILRLHLFPAFGSMQIGDIKRSDIVRCIDKIEDAGHPVAAFRAFAVLRRVMTWHAGRDDDFVPPIIRGMGPARGASRERVLSDAEITGLWRATETRTAPFPALVRFLLLTGARRSEAMQMRWDELSGTDWLLPAARNKTKKDLLRPLSAAAMAVLNGIPRMGEFVFTLDGKKPIAGVSKWTDQAREAIGAKDWTLHDLRRSARSLMSRAGVPDRHAEECLGHVPRGILGTYDRHRYRDEMLRAYEALASQIERIVNPQENVVGFGRGAA
jgi:integrase